MCSFYYINYQQRISDLEVLTHFWQSLGFSSQYILMHTGSVRHTQGVSSRHTHTHIWTPESYTHAIADTHVSSPHVSDCPCIYASFVIELIGNKEVLHKSSSVLFWNKHEFLLSGEKTWIIVCICSLVMLLLIAASCLEIAIYTFLKQFLRIYSLWREGLAKCLDM